MTNFIIVFISFVIGSIFGFIIAGVLSSSKLERNYCIRSIYWLLTEIESGKKDIDYVKKAIEEGKFELW